jgi:uncharacterized protein (DUF1015 family)
MAEIFPFRSVGYSKRCAQDLSRLITPPYDVITPEEQDGFYEAHVYNVIRLVLGKKYPWDVQTDNRYTRAALVLNYWLKEGILTYADRPGLTVYQMEFTMPDGGGRTVDGLVALVKVDDYGEGKVLPHEKTYAGPKNDQLRLLRACRAHLTPIHSLFNDPDQLVHDAYAPFIAGPPQRRAVDRDGVIHRTWTVEDPEAVKGIQDFFRDKSLFIADGHHRYETALAFKAEMRDVWGEAEGGQDTVMMYLTSTSHPGLAILPAHRLLMRLGDVNREEVMRRLSPHFDVEPFELDSSDLKNEGARLTRALAASPGAGVFGAVFRDEPRAWILRLKSLDDAQALIDPSIPSSLRSLDVTILREVILVHALKLAHENPEGHIEYTPSAGEAIRRAVNGEVQVSLILNPTKVSQVETAARLGHKLPHKSTYFYPKVASGMVMNKF